MKTLNKSVLSVAIVAAMAATSAQAEQFMDDSTLNIHLRNYYKQDSVKEGNAVQNNNKHQWSQAIRADFSSGYFADLVGVDLSTHYALKLDSKGDTGLLQSSGSDSHSESYGKSFGAVKVNLMGNGVAKYGRMVLDTPLLNDSDSRSLPSTTEAFYADYSMDGLTVFGAVARKGNKKTETGYEDYSLTIQGPNGVITKDEDVKTLGATYEMGSLALTAAYAVQDDNAKSFYADGSYSFPLDDMTTLTLGAQYGKMKSIGDTKRYEVTGNEKSSIDWYGLTADITYSNLSASVSMTDMGDANGHFGNLGTPWQGGEDDTGFNGYNSVQIDDFYNENETSYKVRVGYDFSDMIEGLSAYALYVDGEIDENSGTKDTDTSEYNIRVDYAVPALDGLTVTLRHAKYEKDAEGRSNDFTKKDTRVIVTYDLAVF